MARKAVGDRGKKTDILKAATKCFLKNGYDGTSIREIMKEAGAEVGLFYYYFEGKDDVFHQALSNFYKDYTDELREIVSYAKEDSFRVLTKIFLVLNRMVADFRGKYADKLHPSVQAALRDHILEEITTDVKEVLEILDSLGAKLGMNIEIAAKFMTYGVGGIVLHSNTSVEQDEKDIRKCINMIMGLDDQEAELINPEFATRKEAEAIHELHKACYEEKLCDKLSAEEIGNRLHRKEILVIRQKGEVVGFSLFSRTGQKIDMVCVKKEYRSSLTTDVLQGTAMAELHLYQRNLKQK